MEQERKFIAVAEDGETSQTLQNKKTINKYFPWLILIIILAVGGYFLITNYIIPENKYSKAVMLQKSGNYDQAIAAFNELGNYKDSILQSANSAEQKQEAIRRAEEEKRNAELQKGRNLLDKDKFKEAMEVFEANGSSEDIELCKQRINEKSEDDLYKLEVNLISKNYLSYLHGLKEIKELLNDFEIKDLDNDIKTKWDFAVIEYAPYCFEQEFVNQSFFNDEYFKLVNTTKTTGWRTAKKNQTVRFSLADTIGVFIDCKQKAGHLIVFPAWHQLKFNEDTLKFDKDELITAHEPIQLPSLGGYSWFIYSFWFDEAPFKDPGLYYVELLDGDLKALSRVYFIVK